MSESVEVQTVLKAYSLAEIENAIASSLKQMTGTSFRVSINGLQFDQDGIRLAFGTPRTTLNVVIDQL